MGEPMARNLLKAGHEVAVWNRTRAKAERLLDDGGRVMASAAEAVGGAEVVITMVENGKVVGALLEEHGVLEAMESGAVFIDMSSIAPADARRHAKLLEERGVFALDAPVSGGTLGAAAGTLAIMVGGEASLFERCRSLFDTLGRSTWVGPTGAGQLTKLCNQVIVAVTIGAVSEALLLAEQGGADPAAVREALQGGFAESRILREHGKRIIDRNFEPGGPVRNQIKDLDNALQAASDLQVPLPVTALVQNLFRALAAQEGGAELDHSALFLELEKGVGPHKGGE